MNYIQLGDFIHIPETETAPLKGKTGIKFNYYLSSRINGQHVDLDITTKLFDGEQMYIRKACYRVKLGEIEKCVKYNLIDHMRYLGLEEKSLPASLSSTSISSGALQISDSWAY